MKKIVYILSVALLAAACSKAEKPAETTVDLPEPQAPATKTIVFSAAFGESPVTMTQLSGTSVLWIAGDGIKILWDGGSTTALADAGGATANFSASVDAASEYFAVYPSSASATLSAGVLTVGIPSEQHGTFEDANIAIAKTTDHTLSFKNLCALGKITLSRSDIAKVVFRGQNGENLAGDASLNINASGIPTVSATASPVDSIVLTPASGEAFAAGSYYFAAIPGTLSDGVSFTYTTISGNTVFGKASSKAAELNRSDTRNFGTLDAAGSPTTIDLSFNFRCDVTDPSWPTEQAAGNFVTPMECLYPLDGTNYVFTLREYATSTGEEYRIWWSQGGSYGSRLSIDARYRFAGLPAITGYKLVKVVLWQVRKGSSDKSSSPKVVITNGVPDSMSASADYDPVTVSGGENQTWTKGLDVSATTPWTYNLSGTTAGAIYYVASYNTTGCSIGKIDLSYEKVD